MCPSNLLVLALVFCLGCSSPKTGLNTTNSQATTVAIDNSKQDKKVGIMAFPCKANSNYKLEKDIDLRGGRYVIPEGVTIVAGKGTIKNGTLIGNNTQLKGKGCFFNQIKIEGTWKCKEISTSMFKNLSYNNSIVNVFALANHNVNNVITIERGSYNVSTELAQASISIPSNTTVLLNGDINLLPNKFEQCYVFDINNAHSITIKGVGKIIGDRVGHLGKTGEWGFGVRIKRSDNVLIEGITISHCWGDCIYICDKSNCITVRNCNLNNSRRQGISVISANNVSVSDCVISNISGTAPGSAIDIEPNANDTVCNVRITNVTVKDCFIGFAASGDEKVNRFTENVKFFNCHVSKVKGIPVTIINVKDVLIDNCSLDCSAEAYAIYLEQVRNASVTNNVLSSEKYIFNTTKGVKIKGNKIKKGKKEPLFASY